MKKKHVLIKHLLSFYIYISFLITYIIIYNILSYKVLLNKLLYTFYDIHLNLFHINLHLIISLYCHKQIIIKFICNNLQFLDINELI